MEPMVQRLATVVISRGSLFARLGFRRGHPVVGLLLAALVLVLIVLGVVAIVTLLRGQRRQAAAGGGSWAPLGATGAPYDPVIVELRLRYARGEIGRDEYMQRAADLGYRPGPADTTVGLGHERSS
jgi:uncharacterized membrane protein